MGKNRCKKPQGTADGDRRYTIRQRDRERRDSVAVSGRRQLGLGAGDFKSEVKMKQRRIIDDAHDREQQRMTRHINYELSKIKLLKDRLKKVRET